MFFFPFPLSIKVHLQNVVLGYGIDITSLSERSTIMLEVLFLVEIKRHSIRFCLAPIQGLVFASQY